MKPVTNISDPRYVRALSHPLRVRILALLQERTASPRELAEWLDATLGTVSYHVRTLHDFGLIELVKTTQVRGAIAHHYRARVRPRVDDEAWAAAAPIVKQAAVGAALQTVDDYARASAAAGGFDRGEAHLSRTNLRLDAKGWQQAAKACEKLLGDLNRIEEATEKRLAKDPHAAGVSDAAMVLLLFEAIKLTQPEPGAPAGRAAGAKPKTTRRRSRATSSDPAAR
ncbi:MAG TPA: winged helix-turn-helix domain-containing protein [Solirubrobacteraceae bacterium]|nr:winged helix-turn-helix domain-containing protein [Solirubrobacteraceae bacterium]